MLKIHNVRRGFATNSSSSHSIVVLPAKHPVPDEVSDGDGGYGWEDFVLTSPEEKARYGGGCWPLQLRPS
jgi:hypothetical protein